MGRTDGIGKEFQAGGAHVSPHCSILFDYRGGLEGSRGDAWKQFGEDAKGKEKK